MELSMNGQERNEFTSQHSIPDISEESLNNVLSTLDNITPLPPTTDMEDDELPFEEQPHTDISLTEVNRITICEECKNNKMPDILPMEEDELPFEKQSHTNISLDNLENQNIPLDDGE